MPATLVQSHPFHGDGDGCGGSIGTVTSGNTLVIIVSARTDIGSAPMSGVTEDGTYARGAITVLHGGTDNADTTENLQIFRGTITSSGAASINFTNDQATAANVNIYVLEFLGVKTSATPFRDSKGATGTSGNPATASVTTTANELLVAACIYVGTSIATGSGFTQVINDTGNEPKTHVQYKTNPSGNQTCAWTGVSLTDYVAVGISLKIAAPTAPSVPAASALGQSSIRVTYTDNSNNEDGFIVERSADGVTGFASVGTPAAGIATYDDTGLSANTTYYYRVKATNAGGNSATTSVVNAATHDLTPGDSPANTFGDVFGGGF